MVWDQGTHSTYISCWNISRVLLRCCSILCRGIPRVLADLSWWQGWVIHVVRLLSSCCYLPGCSSRNSMTGRNYPKGSSMPSTITRTHKMCDTDFWKKLLIPEYGFLVEAFDVGTCKTYHIFYFNAKIVFLCSASSLALSWLSCERSYQFFLFPIGSQLNRIWFPMRIPAW